jgi:hypothetical protein
MSTARDPVALLRFALREDDHLLALALVCSFRGHPSLTRRAELELRSQPRLPGPATRPRP